MKAQQSLLSHRRASCVPEAVGCGGHLARRMFRYYYGSVSLVKVKKKQSWSEPDYQLLGVLEDVQHTDCILLSDELRPQVTRTQTEGEWHLRSLIRFFLPLVTAS